MTAPIAIPTLVAWLAGRGIWDTDSKPEGGADALRSVSEATFGEIVLEEMLRRSAEIAPEIRPIPPEGTAGHSREIPAPPTVATRSPTSPEGDVPGRETGVIAREAERAGIDPALLAALRRVENGGPGREFGVLAVHAPGLEGQARVAATTIRKSVVRFERQGSAAVDPATGRYTEAFLRFFSGRYAPLGAANDPTGLNRFHAANLIAQYRRVGGERDRG